MTRETGARRERAREEKRSRDDKRDARDGRDDTRRKESAKDAKRENRDDRDGAGRLDLPQEQRASVLPRLNLDSEGFGVASEKFARYMGTANFLIVMSGFIILYVLINLTPLKFDEYPFVFLTLLLSLQASYAAPLILLAQNRQDDRDRVAIEQDRSRDERNLADTEFLTREVASLRLAMRETATRDFVRSELRSLLDEMEERGLLTAPESDDEENSAKGERRRRRESHPEV